MYMSDLNIRSALMKNPGLVVNRDIICFSFDNIAENYMVMTRSINFKSDHIKYASVVLTTMYDKLIKVKIYGIYNQKQFCPIYIIYNNQIWLLVKNIIFDINNNDVRFQKHNESHIEILHYQLLQQLCDEIGVSIIPPYSDIISLSFENHLDYLNDSIRLIMNNLNYIDYSSLDRVEKIFSFITKQNYNILRLNDEIFSSDMTNIINKNKMAKVSKISFGTKHKYNPNDIISVEEIDDRLYKILINLITSCMFIESFRVSCSSSIKIKELTVNRNIFEKQHNYVFNIIKQITDGLLSNLYISGIQTINKIDDFNLMFTTNHNIYHIDLMTVPLTSSLII